MQRYDVIVAGLGGMGSAALYHLARRGLRVLGIEPNGIAHDRGSSHGVTRILRKAYFEHPDYVPLLHTAYRLWDELEREWGRRLLHRVGLLIGGPWEGAIVGGVLRSMRAHGLDIEELSPAEASQRFPAFHSRASDLCLWERDAGYLLVEECVRAHVELARRLGATVLTDDRVVEWSVDGTCILVRTANGQYGADRLVVCGGPWAAELLRDLGLPLAVRRKCAFWFACDDPRYSAQNGCPTFGFQTGDDFFYGFPSLDAAGVKSAEHSGGVDVPSVEQVDRQVHEAEERRVQEFLREYLPGVSDRVTRRSVCMYTMTPDQHFILDRHRDYPNVAYAAGFSGHGFKFAPMVGQVMADLATTGATAEPVQFLSAARLTATRPNA